MQKHDSLTILWKKKPDKNKHDGSISGPPSGNDRATFFIYQNELVVEIYSKSLVTGEALLMTFN